MHTLTSLWHHYALYLRCVSPPSRSLPNDVHRYLTRTKLDAILAATVNRKFVHIIRHIIPGRGWTADVEYDRVLEVEKTIDTTYFSKGLNEKPPLQLQAEKEGAAASGQRALKGQGHEPKPDDTRGDSKMSNGKSSNSSKKKKGKKKK
eukprot:m.77044 g.77044  ORF g.77044 m.77044 type:complete len:148 (-) comp9112_c0_seq2:536-979(-)